MAYGAAVTDRPLPVPRIDLGSARVPLGGKPGFSFCPSPRPLHKKAAAKAAGAEVQPTVNAVPPAAGGYVEPSTEQAIKILCEDLEYEPTQADVHEYAEWLGMDPAAEEHLLWIAYRGVRARCPPEWKPCQTDGGEIFYFNFETGESMWEHPCDVHYKKLYEDVKGQSKPTAKPVPSLSLSLAQQQPTDASLFKSPRKLTARMREALPTSAAKQNGPSSTQAAPKVRILEEDCLDIEPDQKLVEEYAQWLGMDLEVDGDLLWIARAGLKEPCPEHWKPCMAEDSDVFYFNFKTGQSIWDHPCDQQYKEMFQQHKAKKA
mmetsp:Transcript_38438/g.105882  ORF Transcript_38438/g.105882 Transcript_38438/m.105882 type:complete len:318 (+) Transcript_38438:47-1000(+)